MDFKSSHSLVCLKKSMNAVIRHLERNINGRCFMKPLQSNRQSNLDIFTDETDI